MTHFKSITFVNTDESAMFHFNSPSQGWANPADCGDFTCTGLYNVLAKFDFTKSTGTPMVNSFPTRFQVTSNNKESVSAEVVPTCEKKDKWNAYMCETQSDDLGILLFES